MDVSRRQFIKIAGLGTAGLFIGTPVASPAYFCEPGVLPPLSGELPEIKMKVVGIGGAGCNCLGYMIKEGLKNIDFIGACSDISYLEGKSFQSKILLGENLGNPRGLGGDTELAYKYAIASRETIRKHLRGSDVVITLAGMGGSTGTGGSPVVAQIAKDLGALSVAVVTMPFRFEGMRRIRNAQEGLDKLKNVADTTIIVPNDAIPKLIPASVTLQDAFSRSDDTLTSVVRTFSDIFHTPRMLAPAFVDVKEMFSQIGIVRIGIGTDKENGIMNAVKQAARSPLLDGISLNKAKKIICNMALSGNELMGDIQDAYEFIGRQFHEDADIFTNTAMIQDQKTEVIIIAAGLA